MTHQSNPELLNTVLQLLNEEGSGGFAEGIRLLVNEAMCQERAQALQAQPYERTDARLGRANGFKPKTLLTRSGPIQFQVPQVRGDLNFYPAALQKGIRSEQARKLALAEIPDLGSIAPVDRLGISPACRRIWQSPAVLRTARIRLAKGRVRSFSPENQMGPSTKYVCVC